MTLTTPSFFGTDDFFFSEVEEGIRWQVWAGLQFLKSGMAVKCNVGYDSTSDISVRRTAHRASIDLWIGNQLPEYPIEVKSRNETFTDGASFPYPTGVVATKTHWLSKEIKPLATLLISRPTKTCLVVPTFTSDLWVEEMIWDRKRGTREMCLAAPRKAMLPLPWLIDYLTS